MGNWVVARGIHMAARLPQVAYKSLGPSAVSSSLGRPSTSAATSRSGGFSMSRSARLVDPH